jgi:hypothetical protein
MKSRKKKYQRKQDLAHLKAQWALIQQISADTKDLDDIPATGRRLSNSDYRSSSSWRAKFAAGFCSELSPKNAAPRPALSSLRASSNRGPLRHYPARSGLVNRQWRGIQRGLPKAPGDSQHVRIPPLRTYPSDVKTLHRLEEDEFFDYEDFASRGDSSPKSIATSCTSIWRSRTSTRKIRVPGKSSSSLPARPPNSACFHRSSWIATSTTHGIRYAQASLAFSFLLHT